jgi:hypothetical protein
VSLDCCPHLGHKLPDRRTCVLLCEAFPACMPAVVRELLHKTRTRLDHPDSCQRNGYAGDKDPARHISPFVVGAGREPGSQQTEQVH